MRTSPCRKEGVPCQKRFLGCHDTCKEYLEFVAEREAENKARNIEAESHHDWVVARKKHIRKKKYKHIGGQR